MVKKVVRKRDKKFMIWLDSSIHQRLKLLGEKEGRAISELIREGIANVLQRREIKKGK